MDQSTSANPNRSNEESGNTQTQEFEAESVTSNKICYQTASNFVTKINELPSPDTPAPFSLRTPLSHFPSENLVTSAVNTFRTSAPLVLMSGAPSVIVQQPQKSCRLNSDLPSPASMTAGQPQSLFLQALSKLNEGSLNTAVMNHFRITQAVALDQEALRKNDISPPDSLASAPPSYSFVLRQMAVRRRPRILGTFIPSPSFIQHTPPPNYAAAFDIYVEPPPPPPPRVYNFGFASMPVVCPDCGYTGMSVVNSKITLCTHLCAVILCILCCWVCAPLPYVLKSCKDVYHYCRNCRNFLGMYCPTNPENAFP